MHEQTRITRFTFGFFTISISDRKADRISARQKKSEKINLLKSCFQWDLISQQQPSLLWNLMPNHLGHGVLCWMGDLSNERTPIQHKTPWPKWLSITLQSSDGYFAQLGSRCVCEYVCWPIMVQSDDIMSGLKLQHFQTYSYIHPLVPSALMNHAL